MSKKHRLDKEFKKLHKPGACLSRHQGYKKGNLCSHRWQAKVKADSDDRYSKELTYNKGWKAKTLARWKGAGKMIKVGRLWKLEPFATGWHPWKNQAHHVLPDNVLRGSVMEFADPITEMATTIFTGLFEEKYNLNDKDNMIPLPTETGVAVEIGLPTHLGSHPTYDVEVRTLVMERIEGKYSSVKESYEEKEKNHEDIETKKLKRALERISIALYEQIWAYGATLKSDHNPIKLNQMPSSYFTV